MTHAYLTRLLPLLAAVLFAACDLANPLSGPRQVSVLNGAFHVGAPNGYCVSPSASQQASDSAVVLIGRCTAEGRVQAGHFDAHLGAQPGFQKLTGPQRQALYEVFLTTGSLIIVFAGAKVLVNLVIDISYVFLDPRIRY